ncbi:MAG TPA: radical SAM protein [Anaerolineaceae bacterium]
MNANGLLHPTDLGILLSYRCTSECAHCIYNCGQQWKDWISKEDLRLALETASQNWGERLQVHLTGGEVFLNFSLLLAGVRMAAELGIAVYAETNAVWCVDDDLVEQRLSALHDAGMRALLVSCSPFHAASVPLERTLRAIEIGVNVFGPAGVAIYTIDWLERIARIDVEQAVPLQQFIERYGEQRSGRMFWDDYGLVAGGRAGYALGHLKARHQPKDFRDESCRWELLYANHSHFDLYGNFIPSFCGGLSLGSWKNLPELRAAYRANKAPPLITALLVDGPYGLYMLARDEWNYQPLRGGYADKCHLCVDVRKHLAHSGATYPDLQPLRYYQDL